MRIVVWGINYAPECIGIGPCNVATCEHLAAQGCEITMLTAFAYYPEWRKRSVDRRRIFRSERLNGIRVVRCWQYVPKRLNTPTRILHEFSFVSLSFLRLLFLPRPDLLIVISPPLLAGALAGWFCRAKRRKYLVHIQDLQPDAAINLGMLKSSLLIRGLKTLESMAYQSAWRISAISEGMMDILRKRGVDEAKLRYFPNGTDPIMGVPTGRFRAVNRLKPEAFLVVYSGNVGVKQGLENLVVAMRSILNSEIMLIICGEGAAKSRLMEMATGLQNVIFKSVLNPVDYREMLLEADLMVVSLASGSGNSFFPSKLLSAWAAAKPVLAICDANSELAAVVTKNRCGVVVSQNNPKEISERLEQLSRKPNELEAMGRAGRELADKFSWRHVLERFVHEAGILDEAQAGG
jgi:colanic acid biosynthesis glycosyl transferase WcaI